MQLFAFSSLSFSYFFHGSIKVYVVRHLSITLRYLFFEMLVSTLLISIFNVTGLLYFRFIKVAD